jgi:chromosome segregation ATPase
MSKAQDFSKLYARVASDIATALDDVSRLDVSNDKGNAHLASVKEKLGDMKSRFDGEISYLEKHAEWENFTIAFFGETNAGKSTIIESLRILFEEKKRQALIERNQATASDIQAVFSSKSDELIEELSTRYVSFCEDIATLGDDIGALVNQTQRDLQSTRQQLEHTQQDYAYCKERLNVATNDLDSTRQALQGTETRLADNQKELARNQGELQQVEQQLQGVRADFQRSQQQLTEQGAQLQAVQAQLGECLRQSEAVRTSLEQQAKLKLVIGLVGGVVIGVIAGALGYAQLL